MEGNGMVKQWKSGKGRGKEEKYKCKPGRIDRVEGKDRWVRKLRNIRWGISCKDTRWNFWVIFGMICVTLCGYGFCLFDRIIKVSLLLREKIPFKRENSF